jgi:2-methylcitrate dehydratase PrpD
VATLAEDVASFVDDLTWRNVPPDIQARARDRLLDELSTAIASRNIA